MKGFYITNYLENALINLLYKVIFRRRVPLATNSSSLEIVRYIVVIVIFVIATHFNFCIWKKAKDAHKKI